MNEPKFQYSVFAGDNRQEQYVVRADSISDLHNQIEDLRTMLKGGVERPVPVPVVTLPQAQEIAKQLQTPQRDLTPDEIIAKYNLTDMLALQIKTPCKHCHGPQVYNPKTGKVFCQAKCWLNGRQS